MFHDDFTKRDVVRSAFMLKKYKESDVLKDEDQADTLIDLADIVKIDVNLQRTQLITLCKSMYNLKLMKQISKKIHQQSNKNKIYYYVISSYIKVKKMINKIYNVKFNFIADIFKTVYVHTTEKVNALDAINDAANASIFVNKIFDDRLNFKRSRLSRRKRKMLLSCNLF
jgi:hypothetical protein